MTETERPTTIPVPVAKGGYHFDGSSQHHGPCVCCGRDVKNPGAWVLLVDGGAALGLPGDEQWFIQNDSGYMGFHPVGSDCVKLIPVEYREKQVYMGEAVSGDSLIAASTHTLGTSSPSGQEASETMAEEATSSKADEHWSTEAGRHEFTLAEGESTMNPASTKHRIFGPCRVEYIVHADGGIDFVIEDVE